MPTLLCPNDLTAVYLHDGEPMATCPTCDSVLTIAVIPFRFGCDHQPRPVRGQYQWGKQTIPFQFCSADCKAECETEYPFGVEEITS